MIRWVACVALQVVGVLLLHLGGYGERASETGDGLLLTARQVSTVGAVLVAIGTAVRP